MLEPIQVDVARKPWISGDIRQVDPFRSQGLDMRPGGAKMPIAEGDFPRPQPERGEQDPLGGTALMRGKNPRKPGQLFHRFRELTVAGRSRVGLVAAHQRAPLALRHRCRAAVSQ